MTNVETKDNENENSQMSNMNIDLPFIDDNDVPVVYTPSEYDKTTESGITYAWNVQSGGLRVSGVKDVSLFDLVLTGSVQGCTFDYNDNDLITYDPMTYDAYTSITSCIDSYPNPRPPSVFGNNFQEASVVQDLQIRSALDGPVITIQADDAGMYLVQWCLEMRPGTEICKVDILVRGSLKASSDLHSVLEGARNWSCKSGFVVTRLEEGVNVLKLTYSPQQPQQVIGTLVPSYVRNARLACYQVRHA